MQNILLSWDWRKADDIIHVCYSLVTITQLTEFSKYNLYGHFT